MILEAFAAAVVAAGIWQGTLEREGAPLEVEITISERGNALEGTFSSAQLRAVNIPLSKVAFDAPRVRWQLVGDRTTMVVDATVAGDKLAGTFTEGTASGAMSLRRATESRFPARGEEVTFAGADAVTLAGTILWPSGDGPFPGIVFLHGSGAEGRWGSLYLAHEFARAGIAALVYDKRGVGASQGDWRSAGFEELVKDAAAAVEALRARPAVVPTRFGIHGHSQGGTIAPWVAVANPNVAFVIASAASGVTMAEAEIYSLDNTVRARGVAPEDEALAKRYVRAVVAVAYEGAPRSQLDEARGAAQGRAWAFEIPPQSAPYWAFSRKINAYDPLHWWRQVRVPVLLVYGAGDQRVPVDASVKAITASAAMKPEVIVYPDADHGFRLGPRADAFAWPRSAPRYPERIVEWARSVSRR